MHTTCIPTTDASFLHTLESWLRSQGEILVLIRYAYAAGSTDFELFTSFESLAERIRALPSRTCVIAFRQPQLPIRGVVDESFIARCLSSIPDGSEYLLVEMVRRVYGRMSWFHHNEGTSHGELRGELEESRGVQVAVGLAPPSWKDSDDVISAYVPDEDGIARPGAY